VDPGAREVVSGTLCRLQALLPLLLLLLWLRLLRPDSHVEDL
jgi:hypothetical protein